MKHYNFEISLNQQQYTVKNNNDKHELQNRQLLHEENKRSLFSWVNNTHLACKIKTPQTCRLSHALTRERGKNKGKKVTFRRGIALKPIFYEGR